MTIDNRKDQLKVLDLYLGTWLNETVTFPTKAYPVSSRELIIEESILEYDAFVFARQMNADSGIKALWILLPVEDHPKKYIFWYFDSNGLIDVWDCVWDGDADMMFLDEVTLLPGIAKSTAIHTFTVDGSYFGLMSAYNAEGEKVIHLLGDKSRNARILGTRMLQDWYHPDPSKRPLPEELKNLDCFVGTWEVEVENKTAVGPSLQSGTASAGWILNGWFVLADAKVGDFEAKFIATYDPVHSCYRLLMYNNSCECQGYSGTLENNTFHLVSTETRPDEDVTTITIEICGPELIKASVLVETAQHKKVADLAVTLTQA